MNYQLTQQDQKTLLTIARQSIHAHLKHEAYSPQLGETLQDRKCGAFVTLYCRDQLRGCLGRFEANELSLVALIARLAAEAASHDYRFEPILLAEMPDVDIHISILTEPVLVTDLQTIEIGRHGLKIQHKTPLGKTRMGTLLPQVAVEHQWNVEQFLAHTCTKAGLDQNAWQQAGTEIYVYETEVFCDHDFASPPYE